MMNAPLVGSDMANDAANMAAATHIPGFFWVLVWIGISLFMISLGLRLYAINKNKIGTDTVFEDQHDGV